MLKQAAYTPNELGAIRGAITGRLTQGDIGALQKKFGSPPAPHLLPFVKLALTNPDLYEKVSKDERAQTFSAFGFFPLSHDLVYGSEESPKLKWAGETRGPVALIEHPQRNIVIKPFQSSREGEITQTASDLKVGPKQLESLPGFLTEELVPGKLFTRLGGAEITPDKMTEHGRRMGGIFSVLHKNDIYYNDTNLGDDFGKSHLIVPANSPSILIDFGAAIKLDVHPNYSSEDVFNFVRTLPGVGEMLHLMEAGHVQSLLDEYKVKLLGSSKGQIVARDIEFVNQGLYFASGRIGMSRAASEAFSSGFKETYR